MRLMTSTESAEETIAKTKGLLRLAEDGLHDLFEGPRDRRKNGLWNLVVFGRATTNALQRLKSLVPEFSEWYFPFQEEMRNDELMLFFKNLRNAILKEGEPDLKHIVRIKELDTPRDLWAFYPVLPSDLKYVASGLFGSGWEIELTGSSRGRFILELPPDIASSRIEMPDPPCSHMGVIIKDRSIENLAGLYFNYLKRLVETAEERFLGK